MRAKVLASSLAQGLQAAIRAMPSKPIIPSTAFLKLEFGEHIVVTGSDGHFTIEASVPGQVLSEGETLIDKSLVKIANAAGDAELELGQTRGNLHITGHGEAKLRTADAANFPWPSWEVERETIPLTPSHVSSLAISVGADASVPRNSSVNVVSQDGLVFCVTTVSGFWRTEVAVPGKCRDCLIPFGYLANAVKATGTAEIQVGLSNVYLEGEWVRALVPLHDSAPYPIMPALNMDFHVSAPYEMLMEALALADFYSTGEQPVRLEFAHGNLLVQSGGNELGHYERQIEALGDGELTLTRYNGGRLSRAIKDLRFPRLEFLKHENLPLHLVRVRKDEVAHILAPLQVKGE